MTAKGLAICAPGKIAPSTIRAGPSPKPRHVQPRSAARGGRPPPAARRYRPRRHANASTRKRRKPDSSLGRFPEATTRVSALEALVLGAGRRAAADRTKRLDLPQSFAVRAWTARGRRTRDDSGDRRASYRPDAVSQDGRWEGVPHGDHQSGQGGRAAAGGL